MGVVPPDRFPRLVRAAPLHRAQRESAACARACPRKTFAAGMAPHLHVAPADGFVCGIVFDSFLGVNRRRMYLVPAACRFVFELTRSFYELCFDLFFPCLPALPGAAYFHLSPLLLTFPLFPQPHEFRVFLFLLFLLPMNYLSRSQPTDTNCFAPHSLRISAGRPPQLCVRLPQFRVPSSVPCCGANVFLLSEFSR